MKKSLVFSVLLVIGALLLMLYGFDADVPSGAAETGTVVLVVADDTGAFVLQVKQGARKAMAESGGDLAVEIISQDTLVQAAAKWADRGAVAALLLLEQEALSHAAQAAFQAQNIPVALILEQRDGLPSVMTDERQAGELLGSYAAQFDKVYLLGGSSARLEGAQSALRSGQGSTSGMLPPKGENACVVALSAEETLRLANLREKGAFDAPLIGFDPGETRVSLMESGQTEALVCENPYAMGYRAAQAALNHQTEAWLAPCRMVMREDLYSAKNVKLMFPLLN
ncbi:MAG: hypothetical protein RSB91_00985 [Clostridia bacterium]